MKIDTAITLATNASMWGYHRPEIEGMGKWQEGMKHLVSLRRCCAESTSHIPFRALLLPAELLRLDGGNPREASGGCCIYSPERRV